MCSMANRPSLAEQYLVTTPAVEYAQDSQLVGREPIGDDQRRWQKVQTKIGADLRPRAAEIGIVGQQPKAAIDREDEPVSLFPAVALRAFAP